MDDPRLLTNSSRSDRLLRTKLRILAKTLRVRGVEVSVIKSTNFVYSRVHGFNDIDLDGDRADETKAKKYRLVLNLNNLDRVGEKANNTQTCYSTENIADEGDIIKYRSRIYEYAFKVERKSVYGELDFLYEYELAHFRTILFDESRRIKYVYKGKDLDKLFEDHKSDYSSSKETLSDKLNNLDMI